MGERDGHRGKGKCFDYWISKAEHVIGSYKATYPIFKSTRFEYSYEKKARIDLTEMLHFQVKSEEAKYGLIMGKGFPFRQVN